MFSDVAEVVGSCAGEGEAVSRYSSEVSYRRPGCREEGFFGLKS